MNELVGKAGGAVCKVVGLQGKKQKKLLHLIIMHDKRLDIPSECVSLFGIPSEGPYQVVYA